MTLLLPLNGGGTVLGVGEADQTLDGLLRVLRSEAAPIETWLRAAEHLLATGRDTDFDKLLSEAVEREQNKRQGSSDVFTHIQALCSLAEFRVQQAAAERDKGQRLFLLSSCTDLCGKAQLLNHEEQLPELVLAEAALVKGDALGARRGFEKAMRMRCNGRPSIAPHLGLAALHFSQKNYAEALRLYKQALRACPACPPEVRLGVAACCLKLGLTDKAEAAYKRVLDLAPDCTTAMLGLAVLRLNVSSQQEGVAEGGRLLAQAFEQDPANPFVLLLLAHFCLRQGFADKASQLAQAVLQQGGTAAVQAEALTVLARSQHALGQIQEAYRRYQQAVQLDPKLPLPRLGLAQMNVLQGGDALKNATSMLEAVLGDSPHWVDALGLLGRLYPKAAHRGPPRLLPQFKEAAEQRPWDAELWELLGDLQAPVEPAGALKAYMKAIDLHRARVQQHAAAANGAGAHIAAGGSNGGAHLPARLLNNAAVLHLRGGTADAALSLMSQAVQSAAAHGFGDLSALAQVTLGYNLARVKEACGSLQAAEAEYRELLRQFPRYGDCCLRLAAIAKARGDTKEALRWAEQAESIPDSALDSLAMQAALHLERRDHHNAKLLLDRLQPAADSRRELFAKLALGNLHAYTAPSSRTHDQAISKAEQHYTHALEMYRRVLERDNGCIFAANGIGCVLAELGYLREAKEIFLQVQEASAASGGFLPVPDAWINLANVHLAQQQFAPAIQTYRAALRKFFDNRNSVLMIYLARAQYDADQLPEAKRTLTKALHLAPTDHQLRFNVALTMQEWAVRTLKKKYPPGDTTKHSALQRAVRDLLHAHRFFMYLQGLGRAAQLDMNKVKAHIEFVAKAHKDALEHLEAAKKEAEAVEQRQRAAAAEAEALEAQRRLADKRRETDQLAAKRKLEEQARLNQEKLKRLQEQWKTNAVVQKAVAAGDASGVAKGPALNPEAAVDAQVDALFETSSDDEDYNPEADEEGKAAEAADAARAARRGGGAPAAAAAPAAAGPEPAAAAAAGEHDDMFDDLEDEDMDEDFKLEDEGAAGGGLGAGAAAADGSEPPAQKKAKFKHQAVLDDDEDEDE